MRFTILATCCLFSLATSCAAQQRAAQSSPELVPECDQEKIIIPARDEPLFETISYEQLPANVEMIARFSSHELEMQLRHKFTNISTSCLGASLSILQEDLITSGGTPYRRIWLSYVDGSASGMHGPTSQNIYLWLESSGTLSEIYVSPVIHPL